jgi:hypothetical protein
MTLKRTKTLKGVAIAAMALGLLAAAPPAARAATIVYDLGADWSDAANPNGAWSYNDGAGAIGTHQAAYVPLAGNQGAWAATSGGPGQIVSWFKAVNNYALTTGGAVEFGVGDVGVHTWDPFNGGNTAPANVTWTAASDGTIDIAGDIWHAHNTGDRRAVNWTILVNGVAVTGGLVEREDGTSNFSRLDFTAGSGGAAALDDIAVLAGQIVELRLESSGIFGSPFGSFVGMDLTITDSAIPTPAAASLLLIGLAGWRGLRRRAG